MLCTAYLLPQNGGAFGPKRSSLLLGGAVDVAIQVYYGGMGPDSLICNVEQLLFHLPCICQKEKLPVSKLYSG